MDWPVYFVDILEAVEEIEEFTKDLGFDEFTRNKKPHFCQKNPGAFSDSSNTYRISSYVYALPKSRCPLAFSSCLVIL